MHFFTDEDINETNRIKKRAGFCIILIAVLFIIALLSVLIASRNTDAVSAVEEQSTYSLSVGRLRGTIYDCNLEKLTNSQTKYAYAVIPDAKSLYEITKVYGNKYQEQFKEGVPFIIYDEDYHEFGSDYIDTFSMCERYSDVAVHTVGYLNFEKSGISGVEKAFDEVLSRFSGEIKVKYTVNARNAAISANKREITDSSEKANGGVVLTLEKSLQSFCESTARKYIKTGALVVSEVSTGKLRAVVSMPCFSQNDIEASLGDENSPFINRAFCAYTPGSIFKIITSAAALKSNADTEEIYECVGFEDEFWCYNHIAHGEIKGLEDAFSKSCNSFFVNISKSIEEEALYKTAKDFGVGDKTVFCDEFETESGKLPRAFNLKNEKLKALFSFGQGETTVTPVTVTQIVGAVANGGYLISSSLVEGMVNENGKFTEKNNSAEKKKILSEEDANTIKSAMLLAAKEGTAYIREREGSVNYGAKTGTAQTGKRIGENEIVHFWYVGFYPYNNPKYAVVVLSDNTPEAESSPCDEVFSSVIDFLKDYY